MPSNFSNPGYIPDPVQSTIPRKCLGRTKFNRAIFHPVESKQQRMEAIRIGLEELGLSITIAARRVGLRINEAVALYTEYSINERTRLSRRFRSIA